MRPQFSLVSERVLYVLNRILGTTSAVRYISDFPWRSVFPWGCGILIGVRTVPILLVSSRQKGRSRKLSRRIHGFTMSLLLSARQLSSRWIDRSSSNRSRRLFQRTCDISV